MSFQAMEVLLLERLKSEGANSPADIFFTVDAGNLWKIQKEGYFQSISSAKALSIVPKNLRGPNNEWIAIAKRAREFFIIQIMYQVQQ